MLQCRLGFYLLIWIIIFKGSGQLPDTTNPVWHEENVANPQAGASEAQAGAVTAGTGLQPVATVNAVDVDVANIDLEVGVPLASVTAAATADANADVAAAADVSPLAAAATVMCCACQASRAEAVVLRCRLPDTPHATCTECLDGMASAMADADGGNLGVGGGADAAGKLRCPFIGAVGARGAAGCDAEPWDLHDHTQAPLTGNSCKIDRLCTYCHATNGCHQRVTTGRAVSTSFRNSCNEHQPAAAAAGGRRTAIRS